MCVVMSEAVIPFTNSGPRSMSWPNVTTRNQPATLPQPPVDREHNHKTSVTTTATFQSTNINHGLSPLPYVLLSPLTLPRSPATQQPPTSTSTPPTTPTSSSASPKTKTASPRSPSPSPQTSNAISPRRNPSSAKTAPCSESRSRRSRTRKSSGGISGWTS